MANLCESSGPHSITTGKLHQIRSFSGKDEALIDEQPDWHGMQGIQLQYVGDGKTHEIH